MKAFESYTYVSDQFRIELDHIDLEIAEQEKVQNEALPGTQKYRESLLKELKLIEKKEQLINIYSERLSQSILNSAI